MGIRYYADAFDPEHTEQAFADPGSFISVDPLADAWGFPPGASMATPSFEQAVSPRDMLYLDKAWRALQSLTGPTAGRSARPSLQTFEDDVTRHKHHVRHPFGSHIGIPMRTILGWL